MTTPAPYPAFDGTQPCAQPYVDPEWFFPGPGANNSDINTALTLCRRCPFKDPCAAYALHHAVAGIWGATTTAQRQTWRRDNHVIAQPVMLERIDGRAGHGQKPLWRQVLEARAVGLSNPEIADQLGVSYASVASAWSKYKDRA